MRYSTLIRRRGEDVPVQFLDRPPFFRERRRQPVEQLRMRRAFAGAAEVVRIARDCLAKVPLPHAIDDHARRKRIVFAGNPLGQFRAAIVCFGRYCGALFRAGEQAQHARAHFGLRRFNRAAFQNVDAIVLAIGHRKR